MDNFQHEGRLQRLEELMMRAVGGAGPGTFGASTVVWRPGGVTSGNVFATWAEVVAAVAVMNGDVTIGVDTTLAAATIPTGAWDLRPAGISGPVTFVNATKGAAFGGFVTIANAAVTIHGLSGLDAVSIENQSTSNVITVTAADQVIFTMRLAAIFHSALAAGAAFFRVTDGTGIFILDDQSVIAPAGAPGTNALQVVAPGFLFLQVNESSAFFPNMLVAAVGTAQVNVTGPDFGAGFPAYGAQAGAASINPLGLVQKGSAAIVVGTGKTAAIPAFVAPGTRIVVSLKTPVGDAATVKYAALAADRVVGNPGTFQISALDAAGGGAVNGADTSTVDWEVVN